MESIGLSKELLGKFVRNLAAMKSVTLSNGSVLLAEQVKDFVAVKDRGVVFLDSDGDFMAQIAERSNSLDDFEVCAGEVVAVFGFRGDGVGCVDANGEIVRVLQNEEDESNLSILKLLNAIYAVTVSIDDMECELTDTDARFDQGAEKMSKLLSIT